MQRIILILLLSVFVIGQSSCDKIKTELERRHLGAERHKQTALAEKTPDDKHNNVETHWEREKSERKQIVIRIDLPTDEKLQIRLIKLPVSEEKPNGVVSPSNEPSPKEPIKANSPRAEILHNQPEKSVEPDKKESTDKKESHKKTPIELDAPKSEEPKSEIKTDAEQKPKSEMKTDREEPLPEVIPLSAPTVIVPAGAMASEPNLPDANELPALSRVVKSKPAPAEVSVESALPATPTPWTIPPQSNDSLNNASMTSKASSASPWAIPNAYYPLRYY